MKNPVSMEHPYEVPTMSAECIAAADLQYRLLRESDIPGLARLQRECFSRARTQDELEASFLWKYFRNPFGAPLCMIAEHGEQLVGAYGGIPYRMRLGGEEQEILLCTTAQVAPKYEGRGAYRRLQKHLAAYVDEHSGPQKWLGFPNPLAQSINSKVNPYLQWGYLYDMQVPLSLCGLVKTSTEDLQNGSLYTRCYAKATNALLRRLPPYYFFKREKRTAGIHVRRERIEPEGFEDFCSRIAGQYQTQSIRDTAFLKWRFLQQPHSSSHLYSFTKEGQLLGYFVVDQGEVAHIFDFFVDTETDLLRECFWAMLSTVSRLPSTHSLRMPVTHSSLLSLIAESGGRLKTQVPIIVSHELREYIVASRDKGDPLHDVYITACEWFLG